MLVSGRRECELMLDDGLITTTGTSYEACLSFTEFKPFLIAHFSGISLPTKAINMRVRNWKEPWRDTVVKVVFRELGISFVDILTDETEAVMLNKEIEVLREYL